MSTIVLIDCDGCEHEALTWLVPDDQTAEFKREHHSFCAAYEIEIAGVRTMRFKIWWGTNKVTVRRTQ